MQILRVVLSPIIVIMMVLIAISFFHVERTLVATLGWWILLIVLALALLALIFVRFVLVKESTAMAVMRFGKLHRMLFTKGGCHLDANYNLGGNPNIQEPRSWLGGLNFYIWPLDEIYTYNWKWTKVNPDGTLDPKDEKNVNFILVGQDYLYGFKITEGFLDREEVPLEASFTLRAQIVNPQKALWAIGGWFPALISLIEPAVRNYVSQHTYEEVNSKIANLDAAIFVGVRDKHTIIQELREDYGIKLKAIQCKGIAPTSENLEMMRQEKQAQMDVLRDRTKRAGSTTKPFLDMLYRELVGADPSELGITDKERLKKLNDEYDERMKKLLKEMYDDRVKFERDHAAAIKRCKDWIDRYIDAEAGALKSYHFEGGSAGMDFIALLGEALRGGGNASKPDNSGSGKGRNAKGNGDEDYKDYLKGSGN